MLPAFGMAARDAGAREGPVADGRGAEFRRGCVACVPTVLGYLSIGFSAGALCRVSGMSVAEIALACLVLYAGSAQFILAGMVQSQAAAATVWATVFFVNLRHLLMSIFLVPFLRRLGAARCLLLGSQLTDETFGVASAEARRTGRISFWWMLGLNLTAYANWLAGNLAGALAVGLIPERLFGSLRFALVAMFIGLVVTQISAARSRALEVFAALLVVALVEPVSWLVGRDSGVVVTAVAAASIAMGVSRWKSGRKSS